jgi:hypothetical protein
MKKPKSGDVWFRIIVEIILGINIISLLVGFLYSTSIITKLF